MCIEICGAHRQSSFNTAYNAAMATLDVVHPRSSQKHLGKTKTLSSLLQSPWCSFPPPPPKFLITSGYHIIYIPPSAVVTAVPQPSEVRICCMYSLCRLGKKPFDSATGSLCNSPKIHDIIPVWCECLRVSLLGMHQRCIRAYHKSILCIPSVFQLL